MGLLGNLSAGEIVEQLIHANRVKPVRNVVFMGMVRNRKKGRGEGQKRDEIISDCFYIDTQGEPLDNYDNVVVAVKAMIDPGRFGLAPSRVSVSTVGVIPKMSKKEEGNEKK
jgi:sorting nexin-8